MIKMIRLSQNKNIWQTLPTYITVLEQFLHIDAFCVENSLFLASLCGGFAQQAACQAFGLHNDSVLGQCWQDWGQVKVHLAHRQDQVNLWTRWSEQHSNNNLTSNIRLSIVFKWMNQYKATIATIMWHFKIEELPYLFEVSLWS